MAVYSLTAVLKVKSGNFHYYTQLFPRSKYKFTTTVTHTRDESHCYDSIIALIKNTL